MTWQPISTAPKDGRGVLVIDARVHQPEAATSYFYEGRWWLLCEIDNAERYAPWWDRPTHWMPLPTPPKDTEQ